MKHINGEFNTQGFGKKELPCNCSTCKVL